MTTVVLGLSLGGWLTLAVIAVAMVLLARDRPADAVMTGALAVLAASGVVPAGEVFLGYVNPGPVAVAFLFIVAEGVRQTGAVDALTSRVFRGVVGERAALTRLTLPVAGASAFLNNTPIVAMLLPGVANFARRSGISTSKLLIPLSYAAILGGTCTLIGTSTNLVVSGLLIDRGHAGLGMFELSPVAVPAAVIGLFYLIVAGPHLLPDRKDVMEQVSESPRRYMVDLVVAADCPLVGQQVEQAGLRNLEGLFLVEIDRDGETLAPVGPTDQIHAGDRLIFAGLVDTIVDLAKIKGLAPSTDTLYESGDPRAWASQLCEAVMSPSSPMLGKTIRDAEFRSRHDSAVVAVHRNGEAIREKKLGDVVLRAGDTLLLRTGPHFARAHRDSSDFYLVSEIPGSAPPRYERTGVAVVVLAAMVICMAVGWPGPPEVVAMVAAGAMVATRCLSLTAARQAVDWQVLIVIGSALGIARALDHSGAGAYVASFLIEGVHLLPISPDAEHTALLAVLFFLTAAFTSVVGNNAAAALVLSIALALKGPSHPHAIIVALGASACYATPIGYQTNLMVYGPGGYRFTDFLRTGIPLIVLLGVVSVALVEILW